MPLVLNSLAWWLNGAGDRYILSYFCGAAINGIYSVAYKIPAILTTLQNVFYNAWSVSAIKEFDKDDKDGFVGNIYSLYSCVSIISSSIIILLNPFISKILYSKDFFSAWKYVPILIVGAAFNGLALFEGCLFTAVKRTRDVSRTTLIGAGSNILLNFLLIPHFGAYGAAISTLFGYFTTWIARTIFLQNIIKMKVAWNGQIISIFLLLIQVLFASFENSFLYQIPILACLIILQRKFIEKTFLFIQKKTDAKRNKT